MLQQLIWVQKGDDPICWSAPAASADIVKLSAGFSALASAPVSTDPTCCQGMQAVKGSIDESVAVH